MTTNIDSSEPGADTQAMRHAMVASQLRTNAVSDQRIVAAMARVPREAFVPAEVRAIAYRDTALPVANGRAINPPMATGRLLTEAYLLPSDRVLLIGSAAAIPPRSSPRSSRASSHSKRIRRWSNRRAPHWPGSPCRESSRGRCPRHSAGAPYECSSSTARSKPCPTR